MNSLSWNDAEVGAELPELPFPITLKTLVMGAMGTRDLMPYHHNDQFTRSLGMRGAFVNTMFNQALFGRFATDWAGPTARFRSASVKMTNQLVLGDEAIVRGKVTDKWKSESGDGLVRLDLSISNALGITGLSTTVLALPTVAGDHAEFRELDEPEPPRLSSEMPAEAREQVGVQSLRPGPYPVSEAQIGYLAEMVRDANPLYTDEDYATASPARGVIAPPPSLIVWVMDRGSQVGIDLDHPDVELPGHPPWPYPAHKRAALRLLPGMTDVVVQEVLLEFGPPLRPGDRVTSVNELVNCTETKRTKLGPGHFLTVRDTFVNQRDEPVGRSTMNLLQFQSQS
ncbi:MaoC family dehydratase N-terminal domain-containing protein [Amycolatopsis sp. GM8]|uniref:FAS1-like dehydratase domain-containing protein n=1 Tax=Amycolatopsis sp. GM8 TaxID=2896530 RepID=UPI001F18E934|nr:MaoC family dehydratase N-terminal domain-containing protein [Amycolatopsis sp. GM8]